VSIALQALVQLEIDGAVYQPGEWITLPDGQEARAAELQSYGYADELVTGSEEAPVAVQEAAAPVRTRRKRTASTS
jgi:hypothetical protein